MAEPWDMTPAQRQQIREAQARRKAAAMRAILARHMPRRRRHPAEVTSDRLAEARERWLDRFSGEELDMIAALRDRMQQIADGDPE